VGVYLTGVHLTSVHLMGGRLTGVHLTGVYLNAAFGGRWCFISHFDAKWHLTQTVPRALRTRSCSPQAPEPEPVEIFFGSRVKQPKLRFPLFSLYTHSSPAREFVDAHRSPTDGSEDGTLTCGDGIKDVCR
jgi:hypothetical protein